MGVEERDTQIQDTESNSGVPSPVLARRDIVSSAGDANEIHAKEAAAVRSQRSRPCLPGMGIDLSVYRKHLGADTESGAAMGRSQSASAELLELGDNSSISNDALTGITQVPADVRNGQSRPYENANTCRNAETAGLFGAYSQESPFAPSQDSQSPVTHAEASYVERSHRHQANMVSDDLSVAHSPSSSLGLRISLSQLDQDKGQLQSSREFASFAETSGQVYNTPPITPAKGLTGDMDRMEDHKGKRSFEDFRKDADSPSASRFNRGPSVFINGEWSPPPKLRREEHARKMQARQVALSSIRLETEGLRKRVADIEASQVEDRAQEKAQVATTHVVFILKNQILTPYLARGNGCTVRRDHARTQSTYGSPLCFHSAMNFS